MDFFFETKTWMKNKSMIITNTANKILNFFVGHLMLHNKAPQSSATYNSIELLSFWRLQVIWANLPQVVSLLTLTNGSALCTSLLKLVDFREGDRKQEIKYILYNLTGNLGYKRDTKIILSFKTSEKFKIVKFIYLFIYLFNNIYLVLICQFQALCKIHRCKVE